MDLNKILIVIGIAIVLWIVLVYNRLIAFKNRAKEAWSDIEVQLKRRYDLIPNLVETIKGYAAHERGVFEKVTQARSNWQTAGSLPEKAQATDQLSNALKSLFAITENYPDLKANQNFLTLQKQLSEIEANLASSRQFYNDTVMSYNHLQQTFPSNLMANMFGFKLREYFETEEVAKRAVPKVDFRS